MCYGEVGALSMNKRGRELGGHNLTIRSVLESATQLHSERPALQSEDVRLTYRELTNSVASMAQYLQRLGITADDTVVLFLGNTPSCVLCFLALAWLNAAVIPLEPEASSSSYILNLIFRDILVTAVLGERSNTAPLRHAFMHRARAFINILDLPVDSSTVLSRFHDEPIPFERVFLYHYTSGSTGEPKAALHSQANLVRGGIIYKQTYQLRPQNSILVAVPLAHSFGMVAGLVASLVSGSTLVLARRFIPHQVVETLAKEEITVLIAVPFVYELLARCYLRETPDLRALSVSLSSGAPLLPDVAGRFRDRYHKPIYQVYGTTETGVIAAQWPRSKEWPQESVGCPVMDVLVRIVDEDGVDLPANKVGTLLVKNSTMFSGYYKHPDITTKAFQEGWYITGDMAWLDTARHLYLTGRKETFVNVGGKKVNPYEVEKVLLGHPMVEDAVVYGEDAGSGGQEVQAAVVLRGEVSVSVLMQFCRERLPSYKVPSHVEFVATLPRTSLGKVRRRMHSGPTDE